MLLAARLCGEIDDDADYLDMDYGDQDGLDYDPSTVNMQNGLN